ncbi:MAG: response regulator [Polyangiaceae bacterium]
MAETGESGLEIAAAWQPDVALVDVQLSDMDGRLFCRALSERPRTKDVRVVFLTALEASEHDTLRVPGAIGVVSKPFSPATLATELRRLFEEAGTSRSAGFGLASPRG